MARGEPYDSLALYIDIEVRVNLYLQAGEWVEDHIGLQCNFFITLMQAEIDRYLDTLRLLKDYYRILSGMYDCRAFELF